MKKIIVVPCIREYAVEDLWRSKIVVRAINWMRAMVASSPAIRRKTKGVEDVHNTQALGEIGRLHQRVSHLKIVSTTEPAANSGQQVNGPSNPSEKGLTLALASGSAPFATTPCTTKAGRSYLSSASPLNVSSSSWRLHKPCALARSPTRRLRGPIVPGAPIPMPADSPVCSSFRRPEAEGVLPAYRVLRLRKPASVLFRGKFCVCTPSLEYEWTV